MLKRLSNTQLYLLAGLLVCVALAFASNTIAQIMGLERLPVDLALRRGETQDLLHNGVNLFNNGYLHATYPPSYYVLMYPFFAAFSYQLSAWIWMSISLLLLLSSVLFFTRKMSLPIQFFCLSFALACHSTWMALGVGQVSVFISALFLFLIPSLEHRGLKTTIAQTLFITYSVGKFSISLPLIALLLFSGIAVVPILFAGTIHMFGIGVVAQQLDVSFPELFLQFLDRKNTQQMLGDLDLFRLLGYLHIFQPWATLIALGLLGAGILWILNRRPHAFTTAILSLIFGRFWMYHAHYDNIMLFPVALLLLTRADFRNWIHPLFVGAASFSLLIPARFLTWDTTIGTMSLIFFAGTWIGVFFYTFMNALTFRWTKS